MVVAVDLDAKTDVRAALEAGRAGDVDRLRAVADELAPADQVRLGIELFNRRELDLLQASLGQEIEHDMRPTGIPGMGVYRGPAAYRGFLEEWLDAFPDSRLEIESIESVGGHVLAVVSQTVSGASSGVPVSFRYAGITTHRPGRGTVRSEFHTDLERAAARFAELAAG
jgi:SnoaL-like polyketide cyclase